MAAPNELVETVALTLDDHPDVPDDVTYLTQRADTSGSDSDIKLPVVEIQVISSINLSEFNTDKVEVKTEQQDLDGDSQNETVETGRVFHSEYSLDLQIDVWVAEDSRHDVDEIGNAVRKSLYFHDSAGPAEPFQVDIDGDGYKETMDSVWRFKVLDGQREDDLTMSPSLRRWRQDVAFWSYEAFETTKDYITDVHYPQYGGTSDSDGDGQITG